MYHVNLSNEAKTFFENATAKLQKRLDRCFEQLTVNPSHRSAPTNPAYLFAVGANLCVRPSFNGIEPLLGMHSASP